MQAFNRQKHKLEEFRELNKAYFKTAMTQVFLNSFLRPTMEVVNNMVIALLIVYGCGRITGGYLEVGVLYAFTNYVKQFFEPINDLAEKYTTIQSALVSTDRIYEILDEKETEEPVEENKDSILPDDIRKLMEELEAESADIDAQKAKEIEPPMMEDDVEEEVPETIDFSSFVSGFLFL